MKKLFSVACAFAALSSPLMAQQTPVENVDVTFVLQDVESKAAAEFWADLEDDLETGIIALVADRIADDGSEISIDINEFDMSNSFQSALGVDSSLTASIEVKNEGDETKNSYYDLRVTVDEAAKLKGDGSGELLISDNRDEVYRVMVDAFSKSVVERLR